MQNMMNSNPLLKDQYKLKKLRKRPIVNTMGNALRDRVRNPQIQGSDLPLPKARKETTTKLSRPIGVTKPRQRNTNQGRGFRRLNRRRNQFGGFRP